jgi:hypothetical protein
VKTAQREWNKGGPQKREIVGDVCVTHQTVTAQCARAVMTRTLGVHAWRCSAPVPAAAAICSPAPSPTRATLRGRRESKRGEPRCCSTLRACSKHKGGPARKAEALSACRRHAVRAGVVARRGLLACAGARRITACGVRVGCCLFVMLVRSLLVLLIPTIIAHVSPCVYSGRA